VIGVLIAVMAIVAALIARRLGYRADAHRPASQRLPQGQR
jgi:hypothetical protein